MSKNIGPTLEEDYDIIASNYNMRTCENENDHFGLDRPGLSSCLLSFLSDSFPWHL